MGKTPDEALKESIEAIQKRVLALSRDDSCRDKNELAQAAAKLLGEMQTTIGLGRSKHRKAEAEASPSKERFTAHGAIPEPTEKDSPSRGRESESASRGRESESAGRGRESSSDSRPRDSSSDRSPSRPGGLRRRASDPRRRVHFASSVKGGEEAKESTHRDDKRRKDGDASRRAHAAPSTTDRKDRSESTRHDKERRGATYSLSGEELRDRDRADRAESEKKKKKKSSAERDTLAQRFEKRFRGPSRVYFSNLLAPYPSLAPLPPPPPPPPPPHPFLYDGFFIPPPIPDPLAVHFDSISWEFCDVVVRGPGW